MAWAWTPVALPGILSGLAMLALAIVLISAPPSRRNRALAYLLLAYGISDGLGAGLAHSTTTPATALALQRACYFAGFLIPGLYLNFLATLDSPLARPLRSRLGGVLILALLVVPSVILAVSPELFVAGVQPVLFTNYDVVAGPLAAPGLQLIAFLGLYGLATTISAYRRAVTPVGRKWTGWVVAGFAVRDILSIAIVISWATWAHYPLQVARDLIIFHAIPLMDVAVALIMSYGVLHVQAVHRTRFWRKANAVLLACLGGATVAAVAASSANHEVQPGPMAASWAVGAAAAVAGVFIVGQENRSRATDAGAERRRQEARQYALEEAWLMGVHLEDATIIEGQPDPQRRTAPAFAHGSRFAVRRELARGSTSRVLLADDRKLGRPVVLKQSTLAWRDAAARDHFLREAQLLARLQHPNVATVHEVLDDVDPPVLVMEHLEGGSLADELRKGPMTQARARQVADDILAGLAALHKAGIIHRDVKPSNILLDAEGRAKISDLGIAQATRLPGATPGIGTLAYMSPEQKRGEEATEKSDVYSSARILIECLGPQAEVGNALADNPDQRPTASHLRMQLAMRRLHA